MNSLTKETIHIVAIILARGGSKAIPRKNLKLLGGKPLLAWPVELAKSIPAINRVIVSSDDKEIIETAKKYGAEAPFVRPANLSGDDVPTLPVLQHAVKYFTEQERYAVDIVLLLYPTTPFMRRERVIEGIQYLQRDGYDSVVGVQTVRTPVWKFSKKKGQYVPFYPKVRVNRQHMKHLYQEAGNIYFTKANVLVEQNKLINEEKCAFIQVDNDETLDIDTIKDFHVAEERIQKGI